MFNRKKVKRLENEITDLKRQLLRTEEIKRENFQLSSQIFELRNSLAEIKNKVRTQTEADIYFESAKIMKRLENGEKKEEIQEQIAYRDRLYSQLVAQQQMDVLRQYQGSGLLGALGGALGGVFR